MRAYLPAYDLKSPVNLAEALDLLTKDPLGWRLLAGGTDLMVLLEAGHLPTGKFLNLWNLRELKGIVETSDYITLGSLTTFADIQRSTVLQHEYPLLCQAASETGAV